MLSERKLPTLPEGWEWKKGSAHWYARSLQAEVTADHGELEIERLDDGDYGLYYVESAVVFAVYYANGVIDEDLHNQLKEEV